MEEVFVLWCSHRIVVLQLEWTFTFICTGSFGLIQCKIRWVEILRIINFCVCGSREQPEAECVDRLSFLRAQAGRILVF